VRQVSFPNGTRVPALGQGTWKLGEDPRRKRLEIAAIRIGVERGLRVIDTAEMYGQGATELFLGEALAGLRDEVFLVSKAYPQNAGHAGLTAACEGSLRRLKTDRLDLYLLHWRGPIALAETVQAMHSLRAQGKIAAWGVSNFDASDMAELVGCGGSDCATNQILYNLVRRGPDHDLLPWLAGKGVPFMAYSPVEQGRLPVRPALRRIAERHGATPLQVALAWVLMRPGAIVIPKASRPEHVEENSAAASINLDAADLAALDAAYPAPRRRVPLEML
jgi:diketogulonate reductase-like aldo/keto reductase